MKRWLVASGILLSLTTLSIAFGAVPSRERVTNDTVIYQQLSEIRQSKASNPNFDADLQSLSQLENRYQESLPSLTRRARAKSAQNSATYYKK